MLVLTLHRSKTRSEPSRWNRGENESHSHLAPPQPKHRPDIPQQRRRKDRPHNRNGIILRSIEHPHPQIAVRAYPPCFEQLRRQHSPYFQRQEGEDGIPNVKGRMKHQPIRHERAQSDEVASGEQPAGTGEEERSESAAAET